MLGEKTRAITDKLLGDQCEQSESKNFWGIQSWGTHNTVSFTSRSFTRVLQEIPGKIPSAFLLGVGVGWGGANLKKNRTLSPHKNAFPRGKGVNQSLTLQGINWAQLTWGKGNIQLQLVGASLSYKSKRVGREKWETLCEAHSPDAEAHWGAET